MAHRTDADLIAKTRNAARYFTETRHVAWILLVAILVAGVVSYARMPKRKDPFIKVRSAIAICAWPGAAPEKIEELITGRIEERIAQSADVERIESTSRSSVSIVKVTLRENLPVEDVGKAFDDIDLRLRAINDLPAGASPSTFRKTLATRRLSC